MPSIDLTNKTFTMTKIAIEKADQIVKLLRDLKEIQIQIQDGNVDFNLIDQTPTAQRYGFEHVDSQIFLSALTQANDIYDNQMRDIRRLIKTI